MSNEVDVYDEYKEEKKESQDKRSNNREQSAQFLDERGVKYTASNHGAHLIVQGKTQAIDFWPGTGRFIGRKDKQCDGRGVRNLIKYCNVIDNCGE